MPVFPRGMSDQGLTRVIKDGALAVANNKITLSMFKSGMRELCNIYGEDRIYKVRDQLIREMERPEYNIIYNELNEKDYIQQNFAEQKQEWYTKLGELINKNLLQEMDIDYQKIIDGPIKNIDEAPQINYSPNQDDVREKPGDMAMRGIEYVQQARGDKAYKHMRAMLQAIWNIQYVHPQDRFDIDGQFAYNSEQLANYINGNASVADIDQAHELVKQSYRAGQRGRPKGARNKAKVISKDFTELGNLLEDLQTDDVKQEDAPAPEMAKVGENIDLSKFVTHPQLDRKAAELRGDILKIAGDITYTLKEYCEGLEREINNLKLQKPVVVELKQNAAPNINLGVQHRNFADLLAMCHARLSADNDGRCNVWLFGPAGTGKTTAAKMVAKALSLDFYMQSALETGFQILGYVDAHGKYVTTLFRQCWEHGGVIILDEIDSYLPSAAMALNGALANGSCPFADKVVPRHKDCIIIAGANTTGLGGTIEYTGRNKMDAATLDRFVMLDWPIDEALEAHLCPNTAWLAIVRHCRQEVINKQIKGIMVTPRASIYGSALLRAGLSIDRVMASTIKKGMTDAQWQQIKPGQHLINQVK